MQAPKGLVSKTGETLNKGTIYLSETSSPMVFKAYLDQFKEDFTLFLRSRSEEIVPGGGMILTIVGRADQNNPKSTWEVLGRALYNMVLEVQLFGSSTPIQNMQPHFWLFSEKSTNFLINF